MNRFLPILFLMVSPFTVAGQMPLEAPMRVSVDDLLRSPSLYNDRRVRVVGELRNSDFTDTQNRIYELRGKTSFERIRVGQPAGSMNDLHFLVGKNVEIRGVFWDLESARSDQRIRDFPGALRQDTVSGLGESQYFIAVEEVTPLEETAEPAEESDEPNEIVEPDLPDSDLVDLRELMGNPEPYFDRLVSVIGKFRGDNVYADLPMRTKKTPRDFIIKVADVAIWVTGRRPRGEDFELNPERRRDTGKWLKVTGVPWTEGGVVYLRARKIEMVPEPEDPELEPRSIEEERQALEQDESPPDVVFTMPLAGERGVPLEGDFRIQFSKDMNRDSFDRNVDLLYADEDGDGNPFPDMQISYDAPSRSLIVSPGESLLPGKEIHLILYQGIRDTNGLPLVADPEASEVPGAAAILVFFTAG